MEEKQPNIRMIGQTIFDRKIWVNKPKGLKWIWYCITKKPEPEYKTIGQINIELNEMMSKRIKAVFDRQREKDAKWITTYGPKR